MVDAKVGRHHFVAWCPRRALPLHQTRHTAAEPVAEEKKRTAIGPCGGEVGPMLARAEQSGEPLPHRALDMGDCSLLESLDRCRLRP